VRVDCVTRTVFSSVADVCLMRNSENDGLYGDSMATGFQLSGFQADGWVHIVMDGRTERQADTLRTYRYIKKII